MSRSTISSADGTRRTALPPQSPVDYARGMSDDLRESRPQLILMAIAVAAVLIFGAVTLIAQLG
jgi:hypothetical protein